MKITLHICNNIQINLSANTTKSEHNWMKMCKMIKNKMNYAFLYLFIYFATYFLCFRMHWCLCSLLCIGLFLNMSKLCYCQTSMIDQIDHSNESHILYITASLPYCIDIFQQISVFSVFFFWLFNFGYLSLKSVDAAFNTDNTLFRSLILIDGYVSKAPSLFWLAIPAKHCIEVFNCSSVFIPDLSLQVVSSSVRQPEATLRCVIAHCPTRWWCH